MTDPISFTSASPRFSLPRLFAGQAQKEFFVNEANARIDILLHPLVKGVADTPPASPVEGDCWLIGSAPTGHWQAHGGELAGFQGGNWLFVAPVEGMAVYDTAAGKIRRFANGGWNTPPQVPVPNGGTTIDAEARTAIAGLIAALTSAGILAAS